MPRSTSASVCSMGSYRGPFLLSRRPSPKQRAPLPAARCPLPGPPPPTHAALTSRLMRFHGRQTPLHPLPSLSIHLHLHLSLLPLTYPTLWSIQPLPLPYPSPITLVDGQTAYGSTELTGSSSSSLNFLLFSSSLPIDWGTHCPRWLTSYLPAGHHPQRFLTDGWLDGMTNTRNGST